MTNEILKTFLEANSLKELTNSAGRALGCPLLVIDDSFHVAAYFRADSITIRTAALYATASFHTMRAP